MTQRDYLERNQAYWATQAPDYASWARREWDAEEPTWGIWGVSENDLQMLPADMTGMRAIELGCGTAYVSAWMARRGATVTGIDLSPEQLTTARTLAEEYGVDLDLREGNAEVLPFDDETFDFALSEYGAAIWCDPDKWIPEAWRVLKPGGQLVFLGNAPLAMVCSPVDGSVPIVEELCAPYFGMKRWEFPGDEGISFCLTLEDWFALFRRVGFTVEDYREPRPKDASAGFKGFVDAGWASRWPSEQIFKLRKR